MTVLPSQGGAAATLPCRRRQRHGFVRASPKLIEAENPYDHLNPRDKEAAMTTTLTVTAKGQVTPRKEILRHLGIIPGHWHRTAGDKGRPYEFTTTMK
jgi:hypothetical protein